VSQSDSQIASQSVSQSVR